MACTVCAFAQTYSSTTRAVFFTSLPPIYARVTFFFSRFSVGPLVSSRLAPRPTACLVRTLVESRIAAPNARAHIKRTPTRAFTRSSGPPPPRPVTHCKCATLAETYLVTVGDKFAGSSGVRRACARARARNNAFKWKRKGGVGDCTFFSFSRPVRFIRSSEQKPPTNTLLRRAIQC